MIARELISEEVIPLHPDDDGEIALRKMQEYGVAHLPVVRGREFLGLLNEDEIIKHGTESPIETYLYTLDSIHTSPSDHLFDVMKKISESDITLVPVITDDFMYEGSILRNDLFEYYNKSFAFSEPGSILVIHVHDSQYSLSEISHIIESEHAMVLSSIVSRPSDTQIILTLKVNKTDLTRIIAALRRFEYDVSASFSEEEVVDNFKERYDAFMRYLDV